MCWQSWGEFKIHAEQRLEFLLSFFFLHHFFFKHPTCLDSPTHFSNFQVPRTKPKTKTERIRNPNPKIKKIPFQQRGQGSKRSRRRWTTTLFWRLCHQGSPGPTWGFDQHPSCNHDNDQVHRGLGFSLGLLKLKYWFHCFFGLLISLFLYVSAFGSLCLFLCVFVSRFVEECCVLGNLIV